ncbi:peptidase M20 [Longibacter salinarum]|uniref:Peptidase M20 n=1 Tax=Longibacter salinarum TaxID=1850348 RepID=A0A2A8CW80_9BACT|nr:M20 family peptidase [Longibacter salinarum]PEN12844.1 peptidase M20 [Longibacter salinarum]
MSLDPLLLAGLALLVLLAVLAIRTAMFRTRQVAVRGIDAPDLDPEAPRRLARALQFKTITQRDPSEIDADAYRAYREYLEEAFPKVHDAMDRTEINEHSILYRWEGTDSDSGSVVLAAHYDVVPVDAPDQWDHGPFDGVIEDDFVYGRGALDDKASAIALFESMEMLIAAGYSPRRTVYLAIGHDEEVGGEDGAAAIADYLEQHGVSPSVVIDEGGAITVGAVPDVSEPVALVGVAEKGYLSVEIRADGMGGHSSIPPEQTSIDVVTTAVQRLRDNPLRASLSGVTGETLQFIAPEMGPAGKTAFANLWLLRGLITWALTKDPTTDAAIRTTTAPTILDAGVKDNVVPSTARAVVNFRIRPSESVKDVMDHVRSQLSDLPITLHPQQQGEPTRVSPMNDEWFDLVQRTIREVADGVVVAPFLVPGTTDSRHYASISEHVYRFAPFRLTEDDKHRIHGINERISISCYRTMIAYYMQIVRNADALGDAPGSDGAASEAPEVTAHERSA